MPRGRGKRKRRNRKVANSPNKAKLGTKQLQEPQLPAETSEVHHHAVEPGSSGRPHRGGEGGESPDLRTEEAVEGDLPEFQADEANRPAEEWGEWPFTVVKTEEDLLALGEWLQVLGGEGEKTPVGIAVDGRSLAFATKEQGWLLPPATDPALWCSVLAKALTTERVAPALVTRDTATLISAMEAWLGRSTTGLLPNIIHDMTALEYTTGRTVARYLSPLKDALDCAAVGPALALEAPKFYDKVAMPLVRHNAGTPGAIEDIDNKSRWTITYDDLLLRVLTHFTKDPTMTRWFQEGKSPLQEFSSSLETSGQQAIAFLLWMICGEDEALVARLYPDWMSFMPEAPRLIQVTHVDKKLPALRMGLIRLLEEYTASRRARTLYDRHSPWGLRPEELLHFTLMGSVCDILDVAVASFLNHGSTNHWLIPAKDKGYPHWLRAQVVGYNCEEPMKWQRDLEELSHLNDPLGQVALEGKVSVG